MDNTQNIFLGLGSNINDRYYNLKNGIKILNNHPHIWVTDKSHIYQSTPMYNNDQDDFYNMVIQIETNLTPLDLLKEIKTMEFKIGRNLTNEQNMPRIIDIDILAFGDIRIHSNLLEIPHPRLAERKFVLKPWNDLAPDFYVSNYSAKVSELLKQTNDSSEVRMVLIFDAEGMI